MDDSGDIQKALEELLEQFNIKLDKDEPNVEEGRINRYGEYTEIISKTQEKLDELNQKSEELLKKTGMTREQLDIYVSDPKHFTPEQWAAIQKLREATELFKKRTRMIVAEEMNRQSQQEQKAVEKEAKKQPHRFGKKKHWIPL